MRYCQLVLIPRELPCRPFSHRWAWGPDASICTRCGRTWFWDAPRAWVRAHLDSECHGPLRSERIRKHAQMTGDTR